jgi:anti-sigma factor RsiW
MTHEQAARTMAAERYLLGEMSELERYQFEAHYFECAECAEDVRLGAAIADEVKIDGRRSAPARKSAPPAARAESSARVRAWRVPSSLLPWAAAAVLALVVGYQARSPRTGEGLSPQAVTPVVLRGASRGELPSVTIAGRSVVALAVDVIANPATKNIAFELLSPASATVVISGRAPLPPSGVPLMVLIPADRLTGFGAYTLVLRDADRADTLLGEYRFDVK